MIEAELEQSLSAKDHNYHFEFVSVFNYFVDCTVETGERTVGDLHGVAYRVVEFRFSHCGGGFVLLAEDMPYLLFPEGNGARCLCRFFR